MDWFTERLHRPGNKRGRIMTKRSLQLCWALSLASSCARPPTPSAPMVAPDYPPPPRVTSETSPETAPSEPAPAPQVLTTEPGGHKETAACEDCLGHLDRFYQALGELEAGHRESNVRILWLGDSHTAADFLTDQVRRDLEQVYPSGGPGYVVLGQKGTRHGGLSLEMSGRWKRQPRDPATQLPTADGIFGYGGVRTLPGAGSRARVTPMSRRALRADLAYRLRAGDSLAVQFGTESRLLKGKSHSPLIEHEKISLNASAQTASFTIKQLSGQPEIFGVDLTTLEPGIVLDTVGLNGARVGTPLAWDPDVFGKEVSLRDPSLVVLMFGTNEVFDRRDPSHYEEQTAELISRIRAAAPNADCWIIGPPDAAQSTGESRERVVPITEAQLRAARRSQCAFTSLYSVMGGAGSFTTWVRASPPLARTDNIHLTVQGYEELGRRLSSLLLKSRPTNSHPDQPPGASPQSGLVASRPAP